jgi:hypothetical protein
MTVSTAYAPIVSPGNDTDAAITVTFPFLTGTLVVTEIAADGTETVKSLTTHYTVTGGTDSNGLPATGSVVPVASRASGTSWRIERSTTLTQASTWAENDPFPQKTIEAMADRAVLIQQELDYAVSRAVKQTVAQRIANGQLSLPSASASKYLGWNSGATALENKNGADFALTIGTVTTGDAGTDAVAELAGTPTAAVLNLTIPRGDQGLSGAGTGDVIGPSSSVASEIALFDGTSGKLLKRATTTGLLKSASGVLSAAVSGTDYAPATSGSSVLKGNGAGGTTAAAATDLGAGLHTIWLPAKAWTPRSTNGAASSTAELTTNDVMLASLDYDASTEEGAGILVATPTAWNAGTVTFKAYWTAASGSGGVAFGLAGYALSNDDAMDTAVSGQQVVTDTLLAANDMHITAESSAITIGGSPAKGDVLYLELTREVGNGSDTLAVDAKLIGIQLLFTTDALTDA